ncbi:MAG: hypothetical protein MUP55_02645 [Candidatus Aenigmarchaeota archaeon]|nr:hypothetical protein [Candidatus Aenigmarchaeota archaeon]
MKNDIADLINENKFIVFLINEVGYPDRIRRIVSAAEKHRKSVCYVCLSTTYEDVLAWMRPANIAVDKFFFIDTLSSHYERKEAAENCFFVSSPSSLDEIRESLSSAIKEKGCKMVIFDAISSLLEYSDLFSILKFTHSLMTENRCAETRKMYLVVREDVIPENDSRRLVTDLEMFADKVVDIRNGQADRNILTER